MIRALVIAALLSAGNAEFETTANEGAYEIVVGREKSHLVAKGPAEGTLAKAMLAKPEDYVKGEAAKDAAWRAYIDLIEQAYAERVRVASEQAGITGRVARVALDDADRAKAKQVFDARYAEERKAACAEQAATLVGGVKPSEIAFETTDEQTLKRDMSEKVVAQQKTAVFEENLAYISTKIVEPVIEAAKKERKRQGEYLRRAKSDGSAPSVLAADLTDRLLVNLGERKAKSSDPLTGWGVFPSVTNVTLKNVVHRRIMDRLAAKVGEIPRSEKGGKDVKETISTTITTHSAKHRKQDESRAYFRQAWAQDLGCRAVAALREDAPEKEREELGAYLTKNASDETVTKSVAKRIDEEFMPIFDETRRELSENLYAKTWPTLADRTWYPDAETADETSARSDFAAAVRAWRTMSKTGLDKGDAVLEESNAKADDAVVTAFEIARGAVNAQTRLVDEVHPVVLAEVRERKDSFWTRTPDLGKVVEMLTTAVEKRWTETKVATLWPKGDAPKNAAEQHAELFPSVKKRIELMARTIMDEIEEPKPDDAEPEEEELMYSIVVSRSGDRVTVKLDQGGKTLVEKSPKAQMGDFRRAMNEVGEKLGREILKLK